MIIELGKVSVDTKAKGSSDYDVPGHPEFGRQAP